MQENSILFHIFNIERAASHKNTQINGSRAPLTYLVGIGRPFLSYFG